MRSELYRFSILAVGLLGCAPLIHAGTVTLGTFTFDSNEFGNSVMANDGGTFESTNWLNVADSDPGQTAALTGANFNTGIANIGDFGSTIIYTIGYSTPIVNGAGADLGLVTGYSWSGDTYNVAVSTDGTTFTPYQTFSGSALGVDTHVSMSYYYGGGGPYATDLVVIPIDLSVFGVASGGTVSAIEFEGLNGTQPDLFRIAGFGGTASAIPEPFSIGLIGAGLVGLAAFHRSRNKR